MVVQPLLHTYVVLLCLLRSDVVPLQLIGALGSCIAPPPLAVAMRTLDTRLKQEGTPPMTSLPLWQGLI